MFYLCAMLNEEEKRFVAWWEENRDKKRVVLRQLYVGLPLAVIIVIAIFVNFLSGWYTRADMVRNSGSKSLFLVLVVAALGITAFIVIFSARHRWDQNEQQYKQLKQKE